MTTKRIQFNNIVQNQLPEYVRADFPLVSDFLKSYYQGQEYQGGPIDLIQNIDQYTKLNKITNLVDHVGLGSDITFSEDTIAVDMVGSPSGTEGFPDTYGLIKINNEIITYTAKTSTSFTGCVRGFSGITTYTTETKPDQLTFSTTVAADHTGYAYDNNGNLSTTGANIENLSSLFLKQFLLKTKHQILPGFEDRKLVENLNEELFIKQAKDFYLSKGTDRSFEILFKALYDEEVRIVRPRDFLVTPSNAHWIVERDLVVEAVEGDPLNLENMTLFQDKYTDISEKAYAPISSVERVIPGIGGTFYKLSLDAGYNRDVRVEGAIYGAFKIQPKTKVIGQVAAGSTIFDVDSTVGFPISGELFVEYNDEKTGVVSYTSKNLTQFFGCSNVTGILANAASVGINTYAYGSSNVGVGTTVIKVRINNVLHNISYPEDTYYYGAGDTAKIKTLGISDKSFKGEDWFYNIAPVFGVKSIEQKDVGEYLVTLKTSHSFRVGDNVSMVGSDTIAKPASVVVKIVSSTSFQIRGQGTLDLTDTYTIKRNILKVISNTYPEAQQYSTNVQNVYKKNKSYLVASPSLPSYNARPLNVSTQAIIFSGTFSAEAVDVGTELKITTSEDHGYYTGDAIYYTPEKTLVSIIDPETGATTQELQTQSQLFPEGLYFIKRLNSTTVKLAKSKTNIFNNKYCSLTDNLTVTNNKIEPYKFAGKVLQSQKLLREFKEPSERGGSVQTQPGFTGMLVNGVEILNYKSQEILYYGKVDNIEVLAPGSNYDIINPPELYLTDVVGTGATGYPAVNGGLQEIRLQDPGFDYETAPIITIKGGNGEGATAAANMKLIKHVAHFGSGSVVGNVGVGTTLTASNSTIGFGTYHKFRNSEEVFYRTYGQKAVAGLTTDSTYWVSHVGVEGTTVKLHTSEKDAIAGINTVWLGEYGDGRHGIEAVNKKSLVESINITDGGENYQNKQRTCQPTGVSTSANTITINNHDYESGEIVQYTSWSGTASDQITGLTTDRNYYVTKLDNDKFRLSDGGPTNMEPSDSDYKNKMYLALGGVGVGTHSFNYQPITVTLTGKVGLQQIGSETFQAKISPVFRGEITSIHLSNTGVGYGSSEILGFNRPPAASLISGADAQLKAVVFNGQIHSVVVLNAGKRYNSPPDLTITGSGKGAVLSPILENGTIKEVKVLEGGSGYTIDGTFITITFSGSAVELRANLQTWRVNNYEKYFSKFSLDDGFIAHEYNEGLGLQYSALYAPRKLREAVYAVNQSGETLYGKSDLIQVNGREVSSTDHSPIIGWAYDGNPIYGPYGYITKSGGVIAQMKSAYKQDAVNKTQRPPIADTGDSVGFPAGFFVEDYTFVRVSDETVLDENNGRFCITPEFPNGTYAYFATIDEGTAASSGVFNGYKVPQFPYLIGDNYKTTPNDFNFQWDSNQDDYDLDDSGWYRNTAPYNLIDEKLTYEYAYIPNKLDQTADIKAVIPGKVNKVGIESGGVNYKVGDSIIFDNEGTKGIDASARVSKLGGKFISSITSNSTVIANVEVFPGEKKGNWVVETPTPHNFEKLDVVTLSGFSTTSSQIGGSYNIGITSTTLVLAGIGSTAGIGSDGVTGIVTYFNVDGNQSKVKSNDVLGIGTESVTILNLEPDNGRIRVLRTAGAGYAHTAGTTLYENPRNFTVNAGFNTTSTSRANNEIYFNPLESVATGVGIGTTISFANPGTGLTQIFIPSASIYIKNHGLVTGDKLTYSPNVGTGLSVRDNSAAAIKQLQNQQTVYAAKISDDLIGISTVVVGLGTTSFVGIASTATNSGLLLFSGIGTGVYHSFTTNYDPITCDVNRHLVTVSLGSTHGLDNSQKVDIDVNPYVVGINTVTYNDFHRRTLINPRSFIAGDVNISADTITISSHGWVDGQPVIFTNPLGTAPGGLSDNLMCYVVRIDDNTIKLSQWQYYATLLKPEVIDLVTTGPGTISPINPPLKVYKDSTVTFDVSNTSLGYTKQATTYSAFELTFYSDEKLTKIWDKNTKVNAFGITRSGKAGVDATATVTLKVDKYTPTDLWYQLVPIFESELPIEKSQASLDNFVDSRSQITVVESGYNGTHAITLAGDTSFTYTLPKAPEKGFYISTEGSIANLDALKYTTISTTAYGPITEFELKSGGTGYFSLPGISTIKTTYGSGAIVSASSTSIGAIKKTKINDIGFNFPSDTTLAPDIGLPQSIQIESLTSLKSIGISSVGRGLTAGPKLIVLDGKTGKQDENIHLKYKLGESEVTILENSTGLSNVTPKIIPIENTSGVGINTVKFDTGSKTVCLELSVGFSTQNSFPFDVGDKVLVEGISVGVGSTGMGYNSKGYNYQLFTLVAVDKNIGGIGSVAYSLLEHFEDKDPALTPGNFDSFNSSGRIVAEKNFPVFNIETTPIDFFVGEEVTSGTKTGTVENWDTKSGLLRISTIDSFDTSDVIKGSSSSAQGIASTVTAFDSRADLEATSKVEKGWETNSGFLNDNIQRVQDSDYYQNLSYSLRSQVSFDTWNDVVSSLNHTLGFKKFSDMQLESSLNNQISPEPNGNEDSMVVGVTTMSATVVNDWVTYASLNCVYDFDLAKENSLNRDGQVISTEVIFSSRVLTDYFESVGNRVLSIDDLSSQFNSNPRGTAFSTVATFKLSEVRFKKVITYVRDKRYLAQRQLMLVDLLHDNQFGYLNQYGRVDTAYDQGSFDFAIGGSTGELRFYPTKFTVNDYDITTMSFNLDDDLVGIGSTTIGASTINNYSVDVIGGVSTARICNLNKSYSTQKIILEITADNGENNQVGGEYESLEFNVVNDGTNVELLEYGRINTLSMGAGSPGFGTYSAYIDGSEVAIDWHPTIGLGTTANVNSLTIGLADKNTASGIGTLDMKHGRLHSSTVGIASTTTPVANTIATFETQYPTSEAYEGAYCIVQVCDMYSGEYQMSEFIVVDDYYVNLGTGEIQGGDTFNTEYGIVQTDSIAGLGTVGSIIDKNGAGATSTVSVVYTPAPSREIQTKVFLAALRVQDDAKDTFSIEDASIVTENSNYTGTHSDIRRQFNLYHDNNPMFRRIINASDTEFVDVSADTVRVPNHYFVTGEKIKYSHPGLGSTQAIGITSTSFVGVGTTTKLPGDVYIVKIDEDTVKLASSAENALKAIPEVIDFTSVGIGTSHGFTATNQNAKVIVALDNIIQSPVVATAITSSLAKQAYSTDDIIYFTGITSFFGGELIQIGSEIMKIQGIGIGSTNAIRVERPWMGTVVSGYSTYTLITKVIGNYNIVENQLNFVEAPYGNVPESSPTNEPDDRDWVGIATGSSFQGRMFMRSGIQDTADETYSKNYIFDSLSSQFNGAKNTFDLKSAGSNVTGIATDNAVILINDVFQYPGTLFNYTMKETAGVTSMTFNGSSVGFLTAINRDAGISTLPMGGLIVSVGSTYGNGYQPLVAAGGTAVVSTAGTVSSISIGNTGSGYRSGIQTTVNVSIQQEDLSGTNIVSIGTAAITAGHITGVAVTNPQVIYKPRHVQNVGYSSVTGITTITTINPHGLIEGNEVKLSGIALTCDYAPPIAISTVGYSTATGIMTVTTVGVHSFSTGKDVIFTGLGMTCALDSGAVTHYNPRGNDYAYENSLAITKAGTQYTVSAATYNPSTGVMNLTVPGSSFTNGDKIWLDDYSLAFSCAKDNHKSTHTYPRPTDPASGVWLTISGVSGTSFNVTVLTSTPSSNTSAHIFVSAITNGLTHQDGIINVKVGAAGPYDQSVHKFVGAATSALSTGGNYAHHFVSASADAVVSGGNYPHTFVSATSGAVSITGGGTLTPTGASYDPVTGDLTITALNHGLTTDNTVGIATTSITFTCGMDQNSSNHLYPRTTDPIAGIATAITATTLNTFTVKVGASPFVKFTPTAATYTPSTGNMVLTIGSHSLTTGTNIKIDPHSLAFRCAKDNYNSLHTYPRTTDPYYDKPMTISAVTGTSITVNVGISTLAYYNISTCTYNASTGLLGLTIGSHDLNIGDSVKIATESLTFTCNKDSYATQHKYPRKPDPTYGGTKVLTVGAGAASTNTFTVNIGVSTVPTFYKAGGTVQQAIIAPRANNNSASKTDPADSGSTVLTVIDDYNFIVNSGISTLDHFYARGGYVNKSLEVIFDEPLSYSNIPLVYSGTVGVGTAATINLQVGQGTSVTDFEIVNTGRGYGNTEVLTVAIGGTVGIPTTGTGFNEFNLTVSDVNGDEFTGWSLGQLEVLDTLDSLFDGNTTAFQTKKNDQIVSIRSGKGSQINVQDVLLIFINDILQVPGKGYTFSGGSLITFTEAPKVGDKSRIVFYKGSGGVDVTFKEVMETVKKGDTVDIGYNPDIGQKAYLKEDARTISTVTSTDIATSLPYFGPGNTENESLVRPINWCRQTEDLIINEEGVGKDRELYEPVIYPVANLIANVGIGSTTLYVDGVRPFFTPYNEQKDNQVAFQDKVTLIDQNPRVAARATANVSTGGTISSLTLVDGGDGYDFAPTVTVGTPGTGFTATASGLSSSNLHVQSLSVTYGGTGYASTNPPQVLIQPPARREETNNVQTYTGDSGVVVGFATTSVGIVDKFLFDLLIEPDSYFRDAAVVGTAITVSQLAVGDYFLVTNSNIGIGTTVITSRAIDNSIIGVGTNYFDNVYQVDTVSTVGVANTLIGLANAGTALTACRRVTARLTGISSLTFSSSNITFDSSYYTFDNSGLSTTGGGYPGTVMRSPFFGNFSWGKVQLVSRSQTIAFNAYTQDGVGGISTSALVQRTVPLKYKGYEGQVI